MAEAAIKYNDFFEEGVIGKVISDNQKILDNFNTLETGLTAIANNISKNLNTIKFADIKDVKDINDLNKQIEELNKTTDATARVRKESKDTADLLKKAEEALKFSQSEEAKQLASLRVQTEAQNKANKEAAKAAREVLTPYQQLAKEYSQNAKAVKDILASKKELTEEDKKVIALAKAQSDELKKIDAAVGQHQRSVGDYAIAGKSLRGSIVELISHFGIFRELIEAVKNAQEGLNKATEVADVIQQKQAAATKEQTAAELTNVEILNEEATATQKDNLAKAENTVETEENTAAQKANTLARAGWIGLIVAGLALAYTAFKKLTQGMWEQIEASEEYTKVLAKTASPEAAKAAYDRKLKEIELEKEHLNVMVEIASKKAEAEEARNAAMRTDVIPERIKLLKEFINLNNEAFELESKHSKEKKAMYWEELNAITKGTKQWWDVYKNFKEAQLEEQNLIKEHAAGQKRVNKQIVTLTDEMHKEILKLQDDRIKQELERIGDEETQKQALLKQSYEIQRRELIEHQRKLGITGSPEANLELLDLKKDFNRKSLEITREYDKKTTDEMIRFADEINKIQQQIDNDSIDLIKKDFNKKIALNNENHKKRLLDVSKMETDLQKHENELREAHNKNNLSPARMKQLESTIKLEKETILNLKKSIDESYFGKEAEIYREHNAKLQSIYDKIADENAKQEVIRAERQAARDTKALATTKALTPGDTKTILEQEEKIKTDLKNTWEAKRLEIDKNYAKEYKAIEDDKTLTDEEKAAKKEQLEVETSNKLENIWNDYQTGLTEMNDKQLEEQKARNDKRIEEEQRTINAILDGVKEGIKRRLEYQEQAIATEQSLNQDAINTNIALINAGNLQNAQALAYNTARKEKLAEQAKQARIKEQKEEEAIELSKTFLSLVAAYAKSGKTGSQAELKAFADTMITKGMAKMIAGFAKGSEGLGDKEGAIEIPGESEDGLIARIDKREKILSIDDSIRLQGMPNKDIVNAALMFKQGSLPVIYDSRHDQAAINNMLLVKEIRDLKQAINDKPVSHTNIDNLGNIMETLVTNGLKQITRRKLF